MEHDIFFSISQTPDSAGKIPTEKEMFENYLEDFLEVDSSLKIFYQVNILFQ